MKLSVADRSVDRIGVTSEASFSVKATGKAFRILSSGLYKDKILAIVRELSCNAFDAHVANNNPDEPFAVHLPNILEPYFAIRDFGIGLSHEDVMSLYATYFESTKSESNDYIGALGLGSKSPFSYVDSFTVISYFNGRKSSYACFINEVDCPVVTRLSDEPTRERNGLEVNIPVEKRMDFTIFRERAQDIYTTFQPCPIVKGDASFKIVPKEVFLEKPGSWRLYKKDDHYRSGAPKAIMGKIAYPIVASSIPHISSAHQQLLGCDLHIEFALGELEFTAGREDLSYDPKTTVPNLQKRLKIVYDEIAAEMSKSMERCKTEFEARAHFDTLKSTGVLRNIGISYLMWQGKRIDSEYIVLPIDDIDAEIFSITQSSYYNPVYSRVDRSQKMPTLSVDCSKPMDIYLKDEADRGSARVRITQHLKAARSGMGYGQNALNRSIFLIEGDQEALDKVRALFEGIKTLDPMDLPKPPPKQKTKVKYKELGSTGNTNPALLTEVEIDLEDGGYYVLSSSGKIKDGTTHDLFQAKFQALSKLGKIPSDMKVYVVPVSVSAKIVAHDDWFEFQPWMEEQAKLLLADPQIQNAIAIGNSYKALQAKIGDYGLKNAIANWQALIGQGLSNMHPIGQFLALAGEQQKAISQGDPQARLIQSFPNAISPTPPTSAPTFDLTTMYYDIVNRYPMFEFSPQAAFTKGSKVKDYIDLVDRDLTRQKRAAQQNNSTVNP